MKTKEEILKNHAEQKYIFGDGMTHKQSLILLNSIYMAMDEYASQFQQEWIPVEVRLPENLANVYTTVKINDEIFVVTNYHGDKWNMFNEFVIAWQPIIIPQPYNPNQQ